MTVLVLTNRRDLTTDYVVRELDRRNIPFFRLNTESLASCSLTFDPSIGSFDIALADTTVDLRDITAAYFRRPDTPQPPQSADLAPADWQYALGEWNAALKSIYLFVGKRWFSHPSAIMLAEDKPRQLTIAAALGLRIPTTRVTNDLLSILRLNDGGQLIGKPLKTALLRGGERDSVVFTSRVSPTEADRAAIALAPAIYQAEVVKEFDVRVTVVGERLFAVAIHSQQTEGTQVDWRKGSVPNLLHEPIGLPSDIKAKCIGLVDQLGLRFGAIDLILDRHGEFWFLECNPNGQWAWIENRTGLPICAAIVDEIERIARS